MSKKSNVELALHNFATAVLVVAMITQGQEWFKLADLVAFAPSQYNQGLLILYAVVFFAYMGGVIALLSVRPDDWLKRLVDKVWNRMLF